jgi:lipoprotein-releasing system ATP-binding protein
MGSYEDQCCRDAVRQSLSVAFFESKGGVLERGSQRAPKGDVPSSWAIETKALTKVYPVGEGNLSVLSGVSFAVGSGEIVGVVGASGSGKSTLLHILGTLDSPTSGSVRIAGRNPFSKSDGEVSRFRNREVGFVFQHNNLLAEFSALENVKMPGLIAGDDPIDVHRRATELLDRVGLSQRIEHFPGQLSGGEQQRVAIARALINKPTVLLADEPSGNLDSRNARNIHELFREVNQILGTTILVVTHNDEFARSLGRRIELRDGQIIADSRPIGLD